MSKQPKIPERFGPEWWSCYAAAFAVERAAGESAMRMLDMHSTFDRERNMRSSTAERCVTIADDAIQGFRVAVEGGCVDDDWSRLYMVEDENG